MSMRSNACLTVEFLFVLYECTKARPSARACRGFVGYLCQRETQVPYVVWTQVQAFSGSSSVVIIALCGEKLRVHGIPSQIRVCLFCRQNVSRVFLLNIEHKFQLDCVGDENTFQASNTVPTTVEQLQLHHPAY
jgi:hypothetical protein